MSTTSHVPVGPDPITALLTALAAVNDLGGFDQLGHVRLGELLTVIPWSSRTREVRAQLELAWRAAAPPTDDDLEEIELTGWLSADEFDALTDDDLVEAYHVRVQALGDELRRVRGWEAA